MTRNFSCKLAASALSLAVLAASASDAFAGWRWHGSSGGSSGGYGSSGGWGGSSGGWGGSSGGWGGSSGGGSSGGWGGHWGGWKHRHRWHGGWGGSSGGWGGSSGGSSGGWGGSSGGSSGGSYYYSPGTWESKSYDPSTAPAADPMTPSGDAPPVPGTPRDTSYRRADGLLAVNVPEDAKVFVNGLATTSTGAERQYVSRDLQAGFNYSYEVKAEIVRDGKTIEQVKQVNLRAGQTAELAFDFPATAAQEPETSLTVHVPAGAKVYLAGNPTKAQGAVRVFRTTGLASGKNWDNYTVRVELEQDGRTVTQEKTISLKAGQSQELTFDFENDRVAAAR
jgi:uncharacterized protein (TIGR03000 family)